MGIEAGLRRGLTTYVTVALAVAIVLGAAAFTQLAPLRASSVPDAPTNVVAAAGDGEASVSWLAPAAGDAGPITGYAIDAIANVPLVTPGPTEPFFGSPNTDSSATPPAGTPGIGVPGNQTTVILPGLTNGRTYRLVVTAYNSAGAGPRSVPSAPVVPQAGATTPQTASEDVPPAGGDATTDPAGTGPTPTDPVTTAITVPPTATGGTVTIAESTAGAAPTGFVFLGQQIDITSTAPTDAANPLTLVFRIDPSFVPATIFRNGVPIDASCSPVGTATPSPCIASGAGTAEVTILTAAASTWAVGIRAYSFTGFFSPVDNQPVINVAKAGSAIPVKFGLGGDQGLTIFLPGYPKSQLVACDSTAPVDGLEETATPGSAVLKYEPGTGRYQYVWKSDKAWAGTCRQFVMKLRDGTVERASFKFK